MCWLLMASWIGPSEIQPVTEVHPEFQQNPSVGSRQILPKDSQTNDSVSLFSVRFFQPPCRSFPALPLTHIASPPLSPGQHVSRRSNEGGSGTRKDDALASVGKEVLATVTRLSHDNSWPGHMLSVMPSATETARVVNSVEFNQRSLEWSGTEVEINGTSVLPLDYWSWWGVRGVSGSGVLA